MKNQMSRFLLGWVFLALLSGFSCFAENEVEIPFEKMRATRDRCAAALSLGFLGKPQLLYGVPTPKIWWGPHSIKNVFTHRLGIFVGGGSLYGESFFGHPWGEVSIYAGAKYIGIEVNQSADDRAIPQSLLSGLKNQYPELKIRAGQNAFRLEEVNLETNEQYRAWKIELQASEDFSGADFEKAARNVAYLILISPFSNGR